MSDMDNTKATVEDAPITPGCRVLLRADYNVPLDAHGQIADDRRIADSLATVQYCLDRQAKVIICSHFGRPDGKRDPQYSLRPIYARLQQLLPATKIYFANDCIGAAVQAQVDQLQNGEILLLENTRFYPEETANDPQFAQALAKLGNIFINDAFGAAHRAHASTAGVAQYLPSYAGLLMAREIDYLSRVTTNPARPFTVIIGGKKVADKLPIVQQLGNVADYILVGGKLAQEWPAAPQNYRAQIFVAADAGLDIAPATVQAWQPIIARSKTIFWNGPLGKFEDPAYARGTDAVARLVTATDAVTVVGGGDTAAAVQSYQFSHVSTGGGAALEFIQGKQLPGIACLQNKGGE